MKKPNEKMLDSYAVLMARLIENHNPRRSRRMPLIPRFYRPWFPLSNRQKEPPTFRHGPLVRIA